MIPMSFILGVSKKFQKVSKSFKKVSKSFKKVSFFRKEFRDLFSFVLYNEKILLRMLSIRCEGEE